MLAGYDMSMYSRFLTSGEKSLLKAYGNDEYVPTTLEDLELVASSEDFDENIDKKKLRCLILKVSGPKKDLQVSHRVGNAFRKPTVATFSIMLILAPVGGKNLACLFVTTKNVSKILHMSEHLSVGKGVLILEPEFVRYNETMKMAVIDTPDMLLPLDVDMNNMKEVHLPQTPLTDVS